jgi:(S)-2-hydroxy-acid oxidase
LQINSPTAMQKMADEHGEVANAKAAANENVIFIMSTLSNSTVEDVGKATENSVKWFQLYIYKNRKLTENLIRRAENSGFKALVLTVDAPLFGLRRADLRNKFTLPSHLNMANFSDVVVSKGGSGINEYVAKQFDPSVTWEDVTWLMK